MKCKVGSGSFSVGPPCENEAIYGWPGVLPEDLRGPFMCEEHFKSGRFKTDPPLIKIKEKGGKLKWKTGKKSWKCLVK